MTGTHVRDSPSYLEVILSVLLTSLEMSDFDLVQAQNSQHFLLSRASKFNQLEVILEVSSSHPNPKVVLPNVRMFLQVVTLLFQTKHSFWNSRSASGGLMMIPRSHDTCSWRSFYCCGSVCDHTC